LSQYAFIVNPEAGKGRGRATLHALRREVEVRGIQADIFETERSGDGQMLAARADAEVVVAVGGDGTINEVANGIIGSGKVLGVIPAGSGNDFVKSARIPTRTSEAVNVLLAHRTTSIDIGCIVSNSRIGHAQSNSQERFFVNGVGIGFDAAVAEQTRHTRNLSGVMLYLVAVLRTLRKYRPCQFHIEIDSDSMSGRTLLVAIGNGACAGGGFYLTPDAMLDDGLLDVCVIEAKSALQILKLVPKVMGARHVGTSGVSLRRGKRVRIETEEPVFVHADGEILGHAARSITVEIRSRQLTVVTQQ
jgi:diacylglycerol kinase (ATP)